MAANPYFDLAQTTQGRDSALDYIARRKSINDARAQQMTDQEMAEIAENQRQDALNPHQEAIKGFQLGMAGSGNNPYGGLIGGVAGGLYGATEGYNQRREDGEGRLMAGLKSFGSLLNPIAAGKALFSPSGMAAATSVAGNLQGQRNQEAKMQALKELMGGGAPKVATTNTGMASGRGSSLGVGMTPTSSYGGGSPTGGFDDRGKFKFTA